MQLPVINAAGIYDSRLISKNVPVSQERTVKAFEIELPTEEGGTNYTNGIAHPISPNRIICVKPGKIRYTVFPFRCHYIHFLTEDPTICGLMNTLPDCFETDKEENYRSLMSRIIRHYRSFSEDSQFLMYSRLLELLYTLHTDAARQGNARGSSHQVLIQETLDYVKEHLTEDLTLERVSQAMSFSPIYFHNTFKESMGKTLREYVEEQRIRKATNLLLTTGYSLTKIAFECGFSSQSYFSYVFKRRMGMTPREYVRDAYKKYEN
ncbi:MAG: helix-turn-helix transcriptional regulator [Clostridia bacterium]|nr:helix-turn-helix transcriptional regulator [Clostridia bacterium]